MADEPKTEKTAESKTTEKPAGAENTIRKEELDQEKQKSFDAGVAKGATKGEKSILEKLGVASVDELKAALEEGKAAKSAIDETKTEAEKAIEAATEGYRAQLEEYKQKTDPILDKALALIAKDETKEREQALSAVCEKLKVADVVGMQAHMHLWPIKEGETIEQHAERVLSLKPSLKKRDPDPNNPRPPSVAEDPAKMDARKRFGLEMQAARNTTRDWSEIVKTPAQ